MDNFIKGCVFIEDKDKSPFQYSFQHEVDEDLECFYTFT